jgi:hypothetical protein
MVARLLVWLRGIRTGAVSKRRSCNVEHQDYLEKYPDGYTCHFVRPNWTLPHRGDADRAVAGGAR